MDHFNKTLPIKYYTIFNFIFIYSPFISTKVAYSITINNINQ